LDLHNCV